MHPNTHLNIDAALCGNILELSANHSRVRLDLTPNMQADAYGLVHGGFIFGAADYAAMLAVNAPNVVLAGAEVRFLAPSRVGESIVFDATVEDPEARKIKVSVTGNDANGAPCFEGTFTCVVPAKHVLAGV
jgi:acyl-coenzyme A thioesterase PaaI-like protein